MSLFSYCCPCFASNLPEYTAIPDEDRVEKYSTSQSLNIEAVVQSTLPILSQPESSLVTPTPSASENGNLFHTIPDHNQEDKQFDRDSAVFKGMVAEQKFFSKSSYDPKFVWINLKSRTLCLSEHTSRDRSHKEASLADITGVIAGPPERFKAPLGADEQPSKLNYETCLSIKFVRGGGIDLKFQSTSERDAWYNTLLRIIAEQKELEHDQISNLVM
jgi:hypothetical protein